MTTSPLDPQLARVLDHRLALAQRQWRSPAVSSGIVRDGALVWSRHVGAARLGEDGHTDIAPDDQTQFLIGSVTKTFTALLVMALRDEGRVDLDTPIGEYLPLPSHGGMLVRHLLSHSSGLQREPVTGFCLTPEPTSGPELLADLAHAEQVLPTAALFHYSNLAFAMLGQLVETVEQRPWQECLQERLLTPLGMTRTGLVPQDDRAIGYSVHPYAGTVVAEQMGRPGAMAAVGELWSTVADLGRYAAFLADPDPAVLAPTTVEEMTRPVVMADLESWRGGYGLGFGLQRRGDRVFFGHGGAMPGFLTGLLVRPADRLGAVVFANTGTTATCVDLAAELLSTVLDESPTAPAPWTPERSDPATAELLGLWWTEGSALELYVEDGVLSARMPELGAASVTRFAADGPDRFRAVAGRERGELLLVERDERAAVRRMTFATYPVTRDHRAFAQLD